MKEQGPRIRRELRGGSIAKIKPGEVYDREALSADRIEALRKFWDIREGRIRDITMSKDVDVVEFVRRRP